MKKYTKFFSLLLVLMMLLALAACGGSSGADANDPNLGVYKLSSLMGFSLAEYAELMEISEEEAADSMTLELKSGGKATWTIDGDSETMNWSLEGDALTLSDSSDSLEGTLTDGVITLSVEGMEITLTK